MLLRRLDIASQTRDLTSDSRREGFNAWKIDSNLYHFYRRHRDPSIVYNKKELAPPDPSLMQLYDSAIRHMEGLENLCTEEIAAVEATLSTAAGDAVNNEAQTQSIFNTVLSVAAIILGIPALFLAFYSAGNIVPLRTSQQLVAFSPVGISIVLAGIILVWKRKFISKTLLALASLVILGLAVAMLIFAIIAPAAP
ncbi:hypothetical protein GSY69_12215 [Brevibacterium sp. 5221]|uniref:Uncharacterized protein n=1 Tax=Brevibacterium rongguiense TaxID=2695267 RepID=A0A6N9HAF2_9MICO|nr:hypothetical protein [Brevibacterium rongguiense]MYM20701.1 hypothetical protein [Brevibacterium rongguiense]